MHARTQARAHTRTDSGPLAVLHTIRSVWGRAGTGTDLGLARDLLIILIVVDHVSANGQHTVRTPPPCATFQPKARCDTESAQHARHRLACGGAARRGALARPARQIAPDEVLVGAHRCAGLHASHARHSHTAGCPGHRPCATPAARAWVRGQHASRQAPAPAGNLLRGTRANSRNRLLISSPSTWRSAIKKRGSALGNKRGIPLLRRRQSSSSGPRRINRFPIFRRPRGLYREVRERLGRLIGLGSVALRRYARWFDAANGRSGTAPVALGPRK
jgi:hypothetical protein